jgi:hypothetical protein
MIGKIATGEICDTTRNSPMPAFIAPQIPVLSAEPPTGSGWIHEIKHDGYSTFLRVDQDKVQAFSRGGHDWTHKYQRIVDACAGGGALHKMAPCRDRCGGIKQGTLTTRIFFRRHLLQHLEKFLCLDETFCSEFHLVFIKLAFRKS